MKNSVARKIGRRAAGSYGRPGSKWMKRQASKAVRRVELPMVGLFSQLTDEQKERALSYDGPINCGRPKC